MIKPAKRSLSFVSPSSYNSGYYNSLRERGKGTNELSGSYQFALIGAGPASFYFTKNLLKVFKMHPKSSLKIDLFDKQPYPTGLIRTGVAPDHLSIKKIGSNFTELLHSSSICRFFGNV